MATKRMKDQFANKAYGSVTESAANTLTFNELPTNVNTFDKIAWIVARIEWYMTPANANQVTEGADSVSLALTSSQNLTTLSLDSPSVIDMLQISMTEMTAVGFENRYFPFRREFGDLPGGGMIIAPRPLYVAVQGESLGAAVSAECRIWFQQMTLAADEYIELVDFYRIVGA